VRVQVICSIAPELAERGTPARPNRAAAGISLAEILSALSFALDLTEGAVPGHSMRSCLMGMRMGYALRLSSRELSDLYYALLLKDIGCSSNAARLCQIIGGGDEREVKAGVKLEDWTRPSRPKFSTMKLLWNTVNPAAGPLRRALDIAHIGLTQHHNNEEMIRLRCDRGASIVRKVGLGDEVAEAVRGLDEHWDGSGYPERRIGYQIPLASRILAVAQHLDAFASELGIDAAMDKLRERNGRWFDPELVTLACLLHHEGTLWRNARCTTPQKETRAAVLDLSPDVMDKLENGDFDLVCEAFADVVDAKSTFTYRHSIGVTEAASRIAGTMGLSKERRQLVHRAALLHDLGKLRVPNSILDKPGKLDTEEWRIMKEHPRLTREILLHMAPFQELATIAGAHHEKLDGTGYPDGLRGDKLCLEARILAVADIYGALTEDRPYRKGMSPEQALTIMAEDVPFKLDVDCYHALCASI
jgi:putative nucleotidyltransferase with HDIG domain